jgi:hypothetical protein
MNPYPSPESRGRFQARRQLDERIIAAIHRQRAVS